MSFGNRSHNGVTLNRAARLTIVSTIAWTCLFGCDRSDAPASDQQQAGRSESATPAAIASAPSGASQHDATVISVDELQENAAAEAVMPLSGKDLYIRHCAACHGERGDGQGVAARFLFPKPRDFRAGRFRLVSTSNNVPTREDLHAVLIRGMPGSSMPPWQHLSQAEREALVDEVLRLWKEGGREYYVNYLKEYDELTDEELAEEDVQAEIDDSVRELTTPGESLTVPVIETPNAVSIARGSEVYAKQGCRSCHGDTGRGDGVEKMVDAEGLPTSARDFTQGIFKGGHDPASLFRRVAYGMPGTPMPGSSSLTPEEVVDVVHFIRSLSTEETRVGAIMNRERILARAVGAIPDQSDADAWSDIEPVSVRVTPLWWRNDDNPGLQVQAVHDGQTIAVRMTWKDDSQDEHALQGGSFEDAAALELYRGDAEPFIGMGSADQSVDVWFWDADRQTASALEQQYPNVVSDVYPFSEQGVETAEYNRPGSSDEGQPEVSMPAAASLNQIVSSRAPTGASDLTVGGPGSVTFRLPTNQQVNAVGNWADGRWTVVLQRAISLDSPDDGVSLEPGDKASIAFALWNGARHDRDGQKLISIWQDLELEK